MILNFIGWIGFAIMAGGLIGIGMLIENIRAEAMKRPRKVNPRPVPQEPEEWAIQRHEDMQTPAALARQFVEESSEKCK